MAVRLRCLVRLATLVVLLAACRGVGGPPPVGQTAVTASPTRAASVAPAPRLSATPVGPASASRSQAAPAGSPPASPFIGLQPPYPVPASCPVTRWSGHERRRAFPAFWLDGDGLAAGNPIGPVLFAGGQKIQWQAEAPGAGDLVVTRQRLDSPTPAAAAHNVQTIGVATWSSNTMFPAAGCWRLEATAGAHHLAVTVYVFPAGCRPAGLREASQAATPAPCVAPEASNSTAR